MRTQMRWSEQRRHLRLSATFALTYLVVGAVWIFLTRAILSYTHGDQSAARGLEAVSNGLFVCFSTVLMYLWVHLQLRKARRQRVTSLLNRKHTAKKLQETQQKYFSLLNQNPDAIVIVDANDMIIEANQTCQNVLGTAGEKLLQRPIMSLFEPDHRNLIADSGGRIRKGEPQNFDVPWRHPERGVIVINVKLVPMIIGDAYCGYFAIARNVTERIQAANDLRAAKELWESFVTHTSDAIVVHDFNFKVIYVNPAYENLYGWSQQELLGQPLPDIAEGHDRELARYCGMVKLGGHVSDIGMVRLRKDGTQLHVSVSLSPMRNQDGEVIAVASITRDMTERVRVEQALRDSQDRYRLIADNMTDVIGAIDVDGTILYAAPSCKSVLGYPADTYLNASLFSFIHTADLERVRRQFFDVVETNNACRTEFRYRNGNGYWGVLEASLTPASTARQVQQVVIVAREITERKHTEELLRKSDKLAAIGQLAAGVAHEIRNPMTSLKGFLQLLRGRVNDYSDYFDIMWSELNRIEGIVSEFLLLAKPQPTHVQWSDLALLLKAVAALLDTQAILNNVQIITSDLSGVPPVYCDENQIKQVFMNIMKNAIEAMPDGGTLAIGAQLHGRDSVTVVFQDDGIGIPEDRIPKLGEPFYTTKERGTGLGLMVSHKIIEAHSGSMQISSESGVGTRVQVTLPLALGELPVD